MAAFTSNGTGGGNWNALATWTDGSNYPGELDNDDTFTIQAGDTVTYNVSETNELGDSTISGLLTFKTDGDTKIMFGNNTLTIADGGELRVGASGAVIDNAQTAELIWNTSSDNSKGISVADGGKLTIYGDPTYYGSDGEDALANNAENTDGDAIIKTKTDMSAKWNVGDTLTFKVENAGDSSSYTDAIRTGKIASFDGEDGTLITLEDDDTNPINVTCAAGVGDTWESPVINATRNVHLYKLNYVWSSGTTDGKTGGTSYYNANRPKIVDANSDGNNNCVISNAWITGFYTIDSDHDFQFLNSTFRNGYYGFYYGSGHTISGNVYSNNYGLNYGSGHTISGNVYSNNYGFYLGSGHTISGNVYSNNYGFYYGSGHTISGNVYSNSRGFYSGSGHTISGNVYSNSRGFYYGSGHTISGNVYSNSRGFDSGSGHTISGRIGYDENDVSSPNTSYDFYNETVDIILLNAKLPLDGLTTTTNSDGLPVEIFCEHHDRTLDAQRIYQNMGIVTKVACDGTGDQPSEDPDGGNEDCIELGTIQSGCNATPNNSVIAWKPHTYRIWATSAAGQKNYKFYVQTTYDGIAEGGLKLTATYLDGVSGGSTSTVTDDSAITTRSDDTDWTQELNVDVTPGEDGWIDFQIELMEYQSGDEVYIFPEVEIT